jgi:hypothetical protein
VSNLTLLLRRRSGEAGDEVPSHKDQKELSGRGIATLADIMSS